MAYPVYLLGCKCPAELDEQQKVVVKRHEKNCLESLMTQPDSFFNLDLTTSEGVVLTISGMVSKNSSINVDTSNIP